MYGTVGGGLQKAGSDQLDNPEKRKTQQKKKKKKKQQKKKKARLWFKIHSLE